MARATIVITQAWQQIASGQATFNIAKVGTGALLFNETGSDVNANKYSPLAEEQFQQTEALATYCRTTGEGWEILVDGAV